jgi:hypothetical protein
METEYICKCCNYKTIKTTLYIRHCKTIYHNENYKTNKYCTFCKKEFTTIGNFRRHYLTLHSDDTVNCNIIKYVKKSKNINENINENLNDLNNSDNSDENKIKSEKNPSNISYTKIKDIVDESNYKISGEIKEEIQEVKEVVNKAITKASDLIKYLMLHHSSTPPLKKITYNKCVKLLKLNYNCPDKTELDKDILYDYVKKYFVRNISNSILSYVNHNKPQLQPIWNTDCARNHYVIKTNDNWNEDKAGVKFSEYIIKPLLEYVKEIMNKYHDKLSKIDMKTGKSHDEVLEHMTKLYNCVTFIQQLSNNVYVQPILKELSPYLRYLSSELNLDDEDDESENEKFSKFEELKSLQQDLIDIVKITDDSDDSAESGDSNNKIKIPIKSIKSKSNKSNKSNKIINSDSEDS